MKKPPYEYRIAIIMAILTVIPIGATQIGWYFYGKMMGFNFGMVFSPSAFEKWFRKRKLD